MAKTVYNTATSIDGYLADPENSLEWLFTVPGGHPEQSEEGGDAETPLDEFGEFLAGVGAICMGSTTYEWILEYEHPLDNPDKWAYESPCWVFTSRDLPAVPGKDIRFASGDVAAVHAEMAEVAGDKDRWIVGGGDLVGQFFDAGLLDEIRVSLAPVFLGDGAPLLPRRILSHHLELTETKSVGQFACLTYKVK
ncbi:dihydrofolate reductase family protein [Glycomyces luteolus]|uniref:Dihydrofolate reductase family protein n=1 Tax=Glycomyces luteolus TaxID=2670330 RepID=A0A9X3PAV0_9ACTN|nr:dihydrofolate reductase family protein [Glycomyces luteolus]MDA1359164.1 dihydrofolate reductase family protein [Glycomyces luteolus]